MYLAGDTVTYGDVADKLGGLGRQFSRSVWSEQYLLDELAHDPNNMMRKYRAAFAQGRGVAWDKRGTFNQRHAIPVTDVASWINSNLTSRRGGNLESDYLGSRHEDRFTEQKTDAREGQTNFATPFSTLSRRPVGGGTGEILCAERSRCRSVRANGIVFDQPLSPTLSPRNLMFRR